MIIFAIVVLAVTFGAILLYQRTKKKQTALWPSTRGRILAAQVYRPSSDPTENQPIIDYEYAVGGNTYRSRRVKYGFTPKAGPTVAKYPVGREVEVFYDPANPAHAVLER